MDTAKRATGHTAGSERDISSVHTAFTWKVRVYYEDTDLGGVVYHANYLRFMERARTEWLRSLGFEQDVLRHHHSVQFVVVEAGIAFRKPARFNDELAVSVEVKRSGRASLVFHQEVRDTRAGHALFCMGEVKVACIDSDTFKPRPLPREILREFAG